MTLTPTSTRRGLLGSLVVATLGGLAGCVDTGETESTDGSGTDNESTNGEPTDPADANDDESGELDIREANVVGVEATAQEGGYEFTVGLRHDDAGEEGYADWWQVERLDGTRLGRRDLRHSHPNEQPFERSETVDVPTGVDCVVVRGHDRASSTPDIGGVSRYRYRARRAPNQRRSLPESTPALWMSRPSQCRQLDGLIG